MPFDLDPSSALRAKARNRAVALWLFVMCGMLLVMVTLGGATRLTGSGLSIMEWAPIRGVIPPVSEAEWQRLFKLYQSIPQYNLVNQGFGLEGFKSIFWLEWTHRLWGRLLGLVFALPLGWFAWQGWLGRRLVLQLTGLLLLGGLQGAVGWFMVRSGFAADSTAVSAYRLVIHLVLALSLYGAVLWMALSLWRRPDPASVPRPGLRGLIAAVCATVALTIVAGGFVAGLKAAFTYNSFPLMDGRLLPDGYAALSPFWRNLTENMAAVQFDHRLLATVTALLASGTAVYGLASGVSGPLRGALWVLAGLVLAQYALGVVTLLMVVPWWLGTAHQGVAVLVLTAALAALHAQPRRVSGAWPRMGRTRTVYRAL